MKSKEVKKIRDKKLVSWDPIIVKLEEYKLNN